MNHNQHQIMNNQGVNLGTGGRDRFLAQQSVVDPCDFSMAQYWQHNQHQFLSHQDVNINTSSANELFPQPNDLYLTNALNLYHYHHQFISY